jgi:hypothetical protein
VACQTVDWKERGHRRRCAGRAAAAAAAGKAAPPVVAGAPGAPARPEEARARAAAAAAAAAAPVAAAAAERCPVCLEDFATSDHARFMVCCTKALCWPCAKACGVSCGFAEAGPVRCPLCRGECPRTDDLWLARLKGHADRGHPAAIYELGYVYAYAQVKCRLAPATCTRMPKEMLGKSAELFARAAALGSAPAAYEAGLAFLLGRGVRIDRKRATSYLIDAAERGYAPASFRLGADLARRSGERDFNFDRRATLDFARAAAGGHARSACLLGNRFALGTGGVARDERKALALYGFARLKGSKTAAGILEAMRGGYARRRGNRGTGRNPVDLVEEGGLDAYARDAEASLLRLERRACDCNKADCAVHGAGRSGARVRLGSRARLSESTPGRGRLEVRVDEIRHRRRHLVPRPDRGASVK